MVQIGKVVLSLHRLKKKQTIKNKQTYQKMKTIKELKTENAKLKATNTAMLEALKLIITRKVYDASQTYNRDMTIAVIKELAIAAIKKATL